MPPGVILAAGDSTRMGFPKALLLTRTANRLSRRSSQTFAEAGIADIVVITGRDHQRIADALAKSHSRFDPVSFATQTRHRASFHPC